MTQVVRRLTKYTNDVRVILKNKHHATNSDIAQVLRDTYSDVSDTTVHRVTQRLHGDGLIGLAPPTKRGCLRYDACVDPHDHFLCDNCDNLRDIIITEEAKKQIACEMDDCYFDGPLVIMGTCKKCQKRRK